jgi:hypothetical protein
VPRRDNNFSVFSELKLTAFVQKISRIEENHLIAFSKMGENGLIIFPKLGFSSDSEECV